MKIFFVVQGLFEKSDSIGSDCVFQYILCRESLPEADIRLYAERYVAERYPGIEIQSIDNLLMEIHDSEAIVVYHYCDGWHFLEQKLTTAPCKVIVRWHNNTPPWFFLPYSLDSVKRTLAGLQGIKSISGNSNFFFACNSEFSNNQLKILNRHACILPKIYPASKYLSADRPTLNQSMRLTTAKPTKAVKCEFHMLFVGRVVAHKGHKHVLAIASCFQRIAGIDAVVEFPGRHDLSGPDYIVDLNNLANNLGVNVQFPGEIDDQELNRMYEKADVFVCMSEHEGFGLPVYEAMTKNIPVVVWGTTAFPEIMQGHALSFQTMDYEYIAHQITRLFNESFRREVLDFQQKVILPEYSIDVVRGQLMRCIKIVNSAQNRIARSSNGSEEICYDIKDNYVTSYDLNSFAYILDQNRLSEEVIGSWTSQYIDFSKFSSNGGRVSSSSIEFDEIVEERHLVFGPYMKLRSGSYRVTFDIKFVERRERSETIDGFDFEFDVSSGSILVRKFRNVRDFDMMQAYTLEFVLDKDVESVDFRIRRHKSSHVCGYKVYFYGIMLSKFLKSHGNDQRPAFADFTGLSLVHGSGCATVVQCADLLQIQDDDEFLRKVYQAMFGRDIDESGRARYLYALHTRELSRASIIDILSKSDEGVARRLYIV